MEDVNQIRRRMAMLVGGGLLTAVAACGGGDGSGPATAASSQAGGDATVTTVAPPKALATQYTLTRAEGVGSIHHLAAMNERGSMAGSWLGGREGMAFVWTPGGGLGELTRVGDASDINDSDQAVGTEYYLNDYQRRAYKGPFRWTAEAGMVSLTKLSPTAEFDPSPVRITNDGRVYGTSDGRAVIWSADGSIQALSGVEGNSRFDAVTRSGEQGIVSTKEDYRTGYLWSASSGLTALPVPADAVSLVGSEISETGYVAGSVFLSGAPDGPTRPFLRRPDGEIVNPPISSPSSDAAYENVVGVSDKGAVLVATQRPGDPTYTHWPVYWSEAGGRVDVIGSHGTSGEGLHISPSGVVSGWYKSGDGAESAFVWSEAEGFVDLNQRIDPAAATRARRALMSTESGYIAVTTEAGALALLSPATATPPADRGNQTR